MGRPEKGRLFLCLKTAGQERPAFFFQLVQGGEHMPGVTTEQIEQAKEWDLLSYLKDKEPWELIKKHPTDKEYRTKTHDSLVVCKGG